MGTPYLSIIIPAYNASESLARLLVSLKSSTFKNYEVIVGDDASNEQYQVSLRSYSGRAGIRYQGKAKKTRLFTIVRLTRNKGPAAARNAAAKRAHGHVLVFLDSDVTVYPDTLSKVAQKFKEDSDLTAITGVWDKHQKTNNFFPQFKALRDWSYWTNERDRDGYYYLFSTRVAAIRRDVFIRLGGFNEAYRQMEDVELTYRIAKRYAIIFAPDVRVHHEFEGFWPVAKKYFWRSFYWTKMYKERRKFDPVATTMWESLAGMTGALVAGFLGIIFITFIGNLGHIGYLGYLFVIWVIMLIVHVFLLRKFLRFVWKEKGFEFAMKSLVTGIALYCMIVAGAVYYQVRQASTH